MSTANTYYQKGNALRAAGKEREALELYEKALDLDSSLWLAKKSVHLLKSSLEKKAISFGNLFFSEGKYKEARAEFKQAYDLNPNGWRTCKKIAATYSNANNIAHAMHWLKKAIQLAPHHAVLFFELAKLYDKQEAFSEALEMYEKALRLSPQNSDIIKQQKLTQKLLTLESTKRLTPYNAIDMAFTFMAKEMPEMAIAVMKRALKRQPSNQELLFSLGNIYYHMHRFKMAARFYRKAAASSRNKITREEISYNLGLALAGQGKWKDALSEWKNTISYAPRSKAALRAKANLELMKDKKITE